MSLQNLIDYLSSDPRRAWGETLRNEIGGEGVEEDPGPCVYFAAHYENLRSIIDCGELLPRNALLDSERGLELSSSGVQARRGKIFLGDGTEDRRPVSIHDCLNFFFNPVNSTIHAFSRNALIRFGPPLKLGILEFPLARIADYLEDRKAVWACSTGNVAKEDRLISSLPGGWQSEPFPWHIILECKPLLESSYRSCNKHRSAEFLLSLKQDGQPQGIPTELASRLLINAHADLDGTGSLLKSSYQLFRTESRLLNAEIKLVDNDLRRINHLPSEPLETFPDFADDLPFKLQENLFAKADLAASNHHGVPHVSRVMFWVHVLTQETSGNPCFLPKSADEHLAQDALFAALIHDLRRDSDREDPEHGQKAADYFSEKIKRFCNNDPVRMNRIKQAVTFHCRPDEEHPDPDEAVFRILKDADALDRGRFGVPCDGSDYKGEGCSRRYCFHKGCAYKTLRLPYKDDVFRRNLAWVAYRIAKATDTAPWPVNNGPAFLTVWLKKGLQRVEAIRARAQETSPLSDPETRQQILREIEIKLRREELAREGHEGQQAAVAPESNIEVWELHSDGNMTPQEFAEECGIDLAEVMEQLGPIASGADPDTHLEWEDLEELTGRFGGALVWWD